MEVILLSFLAIQWSCKYLLCASVRDAILVICTNALETACGPAALLFNMLTAGFNAALLFAERQ